ncbi:MAG: pilus assembly protein TadG-related protein [Anaerolineae bacterium]|uniref:pilus assembly protein TadG-related protein n=1 Tax=Thermogutta sp. TaxID=1962930 RepID=UPI0032207A18
MLRLSQDRQGYSLTLWTSFFTFLLIPILWLAIGIGRYAVAAAEVQEAADLAALAAVRDVDIRTFESSGVIRFGSVAYARATHYANQNTNYLDSQGIRVRVVSIVADNATRTVRVQCAADISPLFPRILGDIVVQRVGVAEVRMRVNQP